MKQYMTPSVELNALCPTDVLTFSGMEQPELLASKDAVVSFRDTYWFDDVGRNG